MKKLFLPFLILSGLSQAPAQSQYASSVIAFSTQWSTTSWSAAQTTGAPNTVGCGDITTSWASASADGQREFLELAFTTPQQVNTVNIFETWNPGAVDTIFLRNSSNGQWNIVYSATAGSATPCPRTFTATFTQTTYTVDAIRIAINSPAVGSWNEIDAVQIQNNCSVSITSGPAIACNGMCTGSATASPTGQSPFTYSWTTSPVQTTATATGLCAGTYSVFVTDAGNCVSSSSITLTQPTPVVLTLQSVTPSTCGNPNGSACVLGSGGVPNYTYSWSPIVNFGSCPTGLMPGSYTCTVSDANGCTSSLVVNIPNTPGPTVTVTNVVNVNCSGQCTGSATANVSGGCSAPYTYSWWTFPGQTTSTATGLCAGSYTVVVTDACGCTGANTVTITQAPQLTATVSGTPETCYGQCDGTLTAQVAGGCSSNYTYSWYPTFQTTPSITGLCAGSYTVLVTDMCGCTTIGAGTVTSPTQISVTASAGSPSCPNCCDGGGTASWTGGTGPYTVLWTPGNFNTASVSGLCVGTYTVCVTDANGCTGCTTVTSNFTVGLEEVTQDQGVTLFPNPGHDQIMIALTDKTARIEKIELSDPEGRLVVSVGPGGGSALLDLSGKAKGIYLVRIETASSVFLRRLVVD